MSGAAAPVATPGLSERAREKRQRILEAAAACFVEKGFHGAGMAAVAERAGISPGLIYRYFKSKSEIVRAIIDLQLERAAGVLDGLDSEEDLIDAVAEAFSQWRCSDCEGLNAALFLEMTAEATRDEEIGEATRDADARVRERVEGALRRSMEAAGRAPDDDAVRRRVVLFMSLVHGLAIRAVREPDLPPEILRAALEDAMTVLLSA